MTDGTATAEQSMVQACSPRSPPELRFHILFLPAACQGKATQISMVNLQGFASRFGHQPTVPWQLSTEPCLYYGPKGLFELQDLLLKVDARS